VCTVKVSEWLAKYHGCCYNSADGSGAGLARATCHRSLASDPCVTKRSSTSHGSWQQHNAALQVQDRIACSTPLHACTAPCTTSMPRMHANLQHSSCLALTSTNLNSYTHCSAAMAQCCCLLASNSIQTSEEQEQCCRHCLACCTTHTDMCIPDGTPLTAAVPCTAHKNSHRTSASKPIQQANCNKHQAQLADYGWLCSASRWQSTARLRLPYA
jgi:hypothetical protein